MNFEEHEIFGIGSELYCLAQETIELARNHGVDAAKCVGTAGISNKLVVENGSFSLANTATSKKLGLLVHKDHKKGSASTNSMNLSDRTSIVKDALSLSSFTLPDPDLVMADTDQAPKANALSFMVDDSKVMMSLEEIGDLMTEILGVFRQEPKFALDRFELSSHCSFHTLVNSNGVSQKEYQTSLHWDYLGMAKEGEEVSGMDYRGGFSFSLDDPRSVIISDVRSFVRQIVAQLHPMKCPAYTGPVLIAPRAVDDLLLDTLLFHASGRAVMDDKSRWGKSVGTKVISDKINLSDCPHDRQLMGATSYDSDGLPTMNRDIIREGVLQTHLHDCYSAKKTGGCSTATSGGPFGLTLSAGSEEFSQMAHARDELLYLTRFSGNVDPLTGDFSGLAKASRLFRNGKDSGPVGETMIAGNVFEMADSILGMSRDTEIVSGSFRSPSVLVDGVTVS